MKKVILSLVAIATAFQLNAQTGKDKIEFKLTLRDASVMTGTTNITSVSLQTLYGKLEVPIKNVTEIQFGIIPDEANRQKIYNLLKQLSNSAEDQRKAAYDELSKLDIKAIPIVSDFIMSQDYVPAADGATVDVVENTPEMILSELKAKFNIEDDYSDKDIVTIDAEYKMGGTYTFKSISLKTDYGQLEIPKEKIKAAEITYSTSDESMKTFKLMASKHISGNTNGGWLNTGIAVKAGQKILITATGEIILASLSNGKYHPNGSTGSTYDGEDEYSATSSTYPSYGNVVYKVGENGTMMKAGANYNGTVSKTGLLYISIYETVFNESNTGFYTVKVKAN